MINYKKLFDDNKIENRNSKKWVNVNCPFCVPKDYHCNGGFSKDKLSYNCWRCGKNNAIDALSRIFNLDRNGAKNLIQSYSDGVISHTFDKPKATKEKIELVGYSELNSAERKYLEGRGFNVDELVNKFGIRGGGIVGEWSYRIILPIYYKGELVSWTARSILDRQTIKELKIPRYKNLSIENSVINPKEIFYNLDNSTKDYVLLVEGAFDVLKMGSDCICSLGTSVTEAQKLLLCERYKKIFIGFDNEIDAQKKAMKLGEELNSVGLEVEVVNICEDFNKNDAGELSADEVKIIRGELFNESF